MTKLNHTSKSIIDMPSKEQLDKLTRPFSDEELGVLSDDMQSKIDKLIQFFEKSEIDYTKFNPESISEKKAYPNTDQYMYIPGHHNTQKWLQTVKNIYYKEKNGANRVNAIRQATSGWQVTETFDFLNWLKYYEEGAHLKYKFAQLWYENGDPGYFLHVKPDAVKAAPAQVSGTDIDFAKETIADEMPKSEKKQIIEKQRNKIIGRLDSAEKLLRSPDGQIFSGKEFENLLEAIYQLKKKVQMVNKISTSIRIYEDMIVREANILSKKGFTKAADMLYKIAQTPAASGSQATGGNVGDAVPSPTPPDEPTKGSGSAGGLPSVGPGMPEPAGNPPNENSPVSSVIKDTKPKGIVDFLEGMDTAKFTTKEDKMTADSLEVEDAIDVAESSDELLVTEAQAIPPAAMADIPITDSPAPSKLKALPPVSDKPINKSVEKPLEVSEKPLEVSENDIPKSVPVSDFDSKVDAAFANLTVTDVVAKLEDLAKIFKTREIPRQLSIVDMMLDSLGLASYFPSLSEATNKALESNNYISTRVEDILAKLRGSMKTKELDMKGENKEISPEVSGIKENLKTQEDKEKARKQMRKEQEGQDLESKTKETPEVEIEEDLAPSIKPAAPVKPATTPLPPPV